jgi:hypothetical protein
MNKKEINTLLEDMIETKDFNKTKYLEFHMDFDTVAVEVVMSLN